MTKLSEQDTRTQYITPAIQQAGWNKDQMREEYIFTDGQVNVRGNAVSRGKKNVADYILFYKKNMPLAIVEAKNIRESVGAGLTQAEHYARVLDVPFAYATNGKEFIEHNMITQEIRTIAMEKFPSPEELYKRYLEAKNIKPDSIEEKAMLQPYYYEPNYKTARYYQRIAINRTVEAVAGGQKRILLVCATGTGKTFMAFQIIHRLWKVGVKKKILFLADRNALVDQAMQKDFKPFGQSMTKIGKRKLDSAYEIYLALYQQLTGEEGNEAYLQFSPDYFDLIVIDECHRGSAKEESAWRKVLDYFSNATHIGCTATPKETKDASNMAYFGEPIYEYSLKKGIEDGFLAPYKVIRIGIDKDIDGYRPAKGKRDRYDNLIEDREYNTKDFDRKLVIDARTKLVAKRITEFLQQTNPMDKTIVFCVDIEHAERMRVALIEENKAMYAKDHRYIMRITGDNLEGKEQLENFTNEHEDYPVIAVTSKLMTTGVDATTCKLIVLDSEIGSMTEFKQIIGRGTRLLEREGKMYFTIMDFRNVTRLFEDKDFDGLPISVIEIGGNEVIPREKSEEEDSGDDEPKKYYVDDEDASIVYERTQFLDRDGRLVTESIKEYSKKTILSNYETPEIFINTWSKTKQKRVIADELREQGVMLDDLRKEINSELDDFDLICHLAYDKKPLTKAERAKNVRKRGFLYKYNGIALNVMNALMDKFVKEGIRGIDEEMKVLRLDEFERIGSAGKIVKEFGSKSGYQQAVQELISELYLAQ